MNLLARRASIILSLAVSLATAAPRAYLRTPDLHGDVVVFSAEGDLFIASLQGGPARRLTTHDGTESHPSFSPDGTLIAFTGGYDGNRDAYVIPVGGGEPRRLTWRPEPDETIGFTPDGREVIFRGTRGGPHEEWRLFAVPAEGGEPRLLPLGYAVRIDIDRESGLWAFNRASWETRTWKRYRGGTATTIWVGHPDRADFAQATRFEGINAFPMWHGGRIYFVSDQGGTANIWSMERDGSDRRQHTRHDRWDVRFPGMGPDGRIVYMLAGGLRLFDPKGGSDLEIEVSLESDRVLTRRRYPDVAETLTWFEIAPRGDRVAIVTRGDIWSVPVKDGVTLPVAAGSVSRESWASFDPKGERLCFVTDESREEAIVTEDAWGRGKRVVVKAPGKSGWHFPPRWSGDGRWIAWADHAQTLWIAPSAGGAAKEIDRSEQAEIREYSWSHDGRFLAYAKRSRTDYSSIHIYDTRTGATHGLSGPNTNDTSPTWDPDGRYLYFLSDRAINPYLDWLDMEYVLIRPTRIYMALLRKDERNPLAPLKGLPGSEEEEDEKEKTEGEGDDGGDKKGEKKAKKKEPPKPVTIDFEGLSDRIVPLPVEPGFYVQLSATSDKVFYLSLPIEGMAEPDQEDEDEDEGPPGTLMAFDRKEKKASVFLQGVEAYSLASREGKLAIMKKRGDLYVVGADSPPGEKLQEKKVKLNGIVLEVEPRLEWAQIYHEGWRLMRDFVWEPGLGGLDWPSVRDQYATLLPLVATREDLRDLMGEVIGELGTSHTYVWGGDPGVRPPQIPTGLLGADLERQGDAFRVTRIYRGDPADGVRSPLDEPEGRVKEGEYVLSVNHRPMSRDLPFEASLANLADRPVVLTVGPSPSAVGSREVVAKPLGSETRLRYADWVRRNRELVASRTGGKMGYLHIPDMGNRGLVTFTTWFYPQLDKEGLVVDVRWNRGGFVSQMILEKLRRKVVSFDRSRGGGVFSYPYRTLNGPFVVITNEFAGSDGDIFPYAVQMEKLAPVIGKRSWGGVIGIRGDKPLVDGGMITQPEYAWWDPKKGWGLENRGVEPDIEVESLPQELGKGVDAQLDRAIEVLRELHAKNPPAKQDFGPPPVKTRDSFHGEVSGADRSVDVGP